MNLFYSPATGFLLIIAVSRTVSKRLTLRSVVVSILFIVTRDKRQIGYIFFVMIYVLFVRVFRFSFW